MNCDTLFYLDTLVEMYPIDRRKIACHIYSMINSLRKTAKLLQVSHSSIQRWIKHPEQKPYTKKSNVQYKSILIVDIIKCSIMTDPFISICKLRELIKETMRMDVSKELIRIAIYRLGITKKKARFYGSPSTLPKLTEEFIVKRQQFLDDGRNFISIDETSFGRAARKRA